jgi:hypothetical protein
MSNSLLGEHLRALVKALWRFSWYHLARLSGSEPRAPVPQATNPPKPRLAVADAATIAALPDAPILSNTYRRAVSLSTSRRDVDGDEFSLNPVFQCWQQQKPRAHKWTHYFEAYQAIFGPYRKRALRILEIGVYEGASLRLWKRYFVHAQTVIAGIDIDPGCAQFDSPRENIHVRIGDQTDSAFLDRVAREFGPFDIIIDDGSHNSGDLIQTFNHLFADALKDDGIYLAEDLHANYWLPWRDTRHSFLDLCKELIELMHAHYARSTISEWLLESNSESDQFSLELPVIATMIKEIRIFDSIAAIQKTRRKYLPRVLDPKAD